MSKLEITRKKTSIGEALVSRLQLTELLLLYQIDCFCRLGYSLQITKSYSVFPTTLLHPTYGNHSNLAENFKIGFLSSKCNWITNFVPTFRKSMDSLKMLSWLCVCYHLSPDEAITWWRLGTLKHAYSSNYSLLHLQFCMNGQKFWV